MKTRINRVADDCIALTFDERDIHFSNKEGTIMLEIFDAEELLSELLAELGPTVDEALKMLPKMDHRQIHDIKEYIDHESRELIL
jgi:hypothetical protein